MHAAFWKSAPVPGIPLGCLRSAVVASDISCTPASSAKMPLASVGMPFAKLMLRCSYLTLSAPEEYLVARDE